MGIFDKLKGFFYDEEEVSVKKPTLKDEVKNDKVDDNPPKEVEDFKSRLNKENTPDPMNERELFRSEPTFKFPVIFEDEDFTQEKKKNHSVNVLDMEKPKPREVRDTIRDIRTTYEPKKHFKPSQIISPIYGVLDKNYKKEDVTHRKDNLHNLYDSDDTVDLDSVIEKAYGRYQTNEEEVKEDIIKEDFYNLKDEPEEASIDLFKDITDEKKETRESKNKKEDQPKIDVDIEVEYNTNINLPNDDKLKKIDELLDNTSEQDFYTLIDKMYKNEEEE